MSYGVLTELDSLRNSLKRVACNISVIQSAMANGVLASDSEASEALFVAWENLHDIAIRISEQVDLAYTIRRREGV